MQRGYTGPVPRPQPSPAYGWPGYRESLVGIALGRTGLLACGVGFLAPEIVGSDAFLEAAQLATVPLGVLFGFLAQAMARIAWEQRRTGERSSEGRHEVLLAFPGFVALIALVAVLVHRGTIFADMGDPFLRELVLWSGRFAGALTVAAFAMVPQLPRLVAAGAQEMERESRRGRREGRRVAARLTDILVVLSLMALVLGPAGLHSSWSDAISTPWIIAAAVVAMFLYETVTTWFGGGLGKRCLGLRVSRSEAPGERVGWPGASWRGVVLAIWWGALWFWFELDSGNADVPSIWRAVTIYVVIGLTFAPSAHSGGQDVHDVLAGTVVQVNKGARGAD